MSYTASIVILTAIATERYIAIRFPLRARRCITQKRLFLVQAIIWMIAAVYGTPYLFIFDLYEMPGMDGEITYYCFPDYSRINMKALVTANFIIWYVIPLALMSYMYCRIGISLWKVSKKPRTPKPSKQIEMPAEDSYYTTSSSEGQGRKRSLRMHKMSSVCNHKEQKDKCLYCKPQNQRNSLKESTKRCSCEKVESERSSASSSQMVDINTNHSRFNCNNVAFVEYKTRETKNVPKLRVYFNTEQTRMNSIRAVRSRRRVIRLLVAVNGIHLSIHGTYTLAKYLSIEPQEAKITIEERQVSISQGVNQIKSRKPKPSNGRHVHNSSSIRKHVHSRNQRDYRKSREQYKTNDR
ncbi:TrissinR [Mytilus coruscus]|uniref:TrissinR n=1 Tax=Mytilus coruscus TaxID=42192 RepID=A0A6J7ZT07_MYTCO|nr:TrissinR [Mytilus coruscus]